MRATDLDVVKRVRDSVSVQFGGGITSRSDIDALREIGVCGCVIEKAFYEGRISPDVLMDYGNAARKKETER